MEEQATKTAKRHKHRKRKKTGRVLLILLLLLLLGGGAYYYFFIYEPAPVNEGPSFSPNASVGALPGKTQEEIEAMLNQKITEKTVAFTVNANPIFATGTDKGSLMLESPANNINNIEFVIKRDDTNEVLYRSGLLRPNQYITEDRLLVDLPAGDYPCTVDITLYDPETNEAKGMTQAAIRLTVKN